MVEDEPGVRRQLGECLRGAGYEVLECGGGAEALRVAAADADGRIRLAVLDLVLPIMSGLELSARLRRERPDLRLLLVSGYPRGVLAHEGELDPGIPFLAKPFTPERLIREVKRLLDGGAASAAGR